MKDHLVSFFFLLSGKKSRALKRRKTWLKLKRNCPEAWADLQTGGLEQNLVDSGLNPGIPLFRKKSGVFSLFHGLVLQKFSRECTLWAVEVNKPYKIEILINQAVMNHAVWLSPRRSINPVQGGGSGGGGGLTALREPHKVTPSEAKVNLAMAETLKI